MADRIDNATARKLIEDLGQIQHENIHLWDEIKSNPMDLNKLMELLANVNNSIDKIVDVLDDIIEG